MSLRNNWPARAAVGLAWRLPVWRAISPPGPTVLLYHGIPNGRPGNGLDAKAFENQVLFLKKRFLLSDPQKLESYDSGQDKSHVILTFDDGYRNHAEVVAPILRRHGVPALFFVSSRHQSKWKPLWSTYLVALREHFRGNGFTFEGEFWDMSAGRRFQTVRRLRDHLAALRPHPSALYDMIDNVLPRLEDFVDAKVMDDAYAGMTAEQAGELSSTPGFSLGCHTIDHPYLTKCEPQEMVRQITENKQWLENVCAKPCRWIAYPSSDYDASVLECCASLGFDLGFAVDPQGKRKSIQEIERLGVYHSSTEILAFKIRYGRFCRAHGWDLG